LVSVKPMLQRSALSPKDTDCWSTQPRHARSTRCEAESGIEAVSRDQHYEADGREATLSAPNAETASGLASAMRTKRNIKRAASPNGMQQNIFTAVTAWPTAPGSVASPSPAAFATTPAIAAPNAVPIERTEAKAEAVLRCSSEVTLSIARATRCTLQTPLQLTITKALKVLSTRPGSKATAISQYR